MKDIGDLVTWIMGILAALVMFGWRNDKRQSSDRIKIITDRQVEGISRLSVVETKVDSMQDHYIQTLEDIKNQQQKMAEDVTVIKIAIASIPKRKEDD